MSPSPKINSIINILTSSSLYVKYVNFESNIQLKQIFNLFKADTVAPS